MRSARRNENLTLVGKGTQEGFPVNGTVAVDEIPIENGGGRGKVGRKNARISGEPAKA